MQARAADSGQGDQGSPAVRGARVRACGGWLPVAGLFVLSGFFSSALFQDGLAAHKKTPSHRHRSSSIPQIIPQKITPNPELCGDPETTKISSSPSWLNRRHYLCPTDQRGHPRGVGAACDIGAFEYALDPVFASSFE